MAKIKVLSLKQPHAYLFSIGAKLNETRSFRTNFRGTLYIHASQKFYFSDLEICRHDKHFNRWIPDYSNGILKTGAIIGKVELVNCVPTESFTTDYKKATAKGSKQLYLTAQEKTFGDYSAGRFAWIGANHTLLETPILDVKGALGIWEYDLKDDDDDVFDPDYIGPDDEGPEPDLMGPDRHEVADRMAYYQSLK